MDGGAWGKGFEFEKVCIAVALAGAIEIVIAGLRVKGGIFNE